MRTSNKRKPAAEAVNQKTKESRFVRVFIIFIVFILFTGLLYQRTSDHDVLHEAGQYFNYTDASKFIYESSNSLQNLNLPIISGLLHPESTDDDSADLAGGADGDAAISADKINEIYDMAKKLKGRVDNILHLITDSSVAVEKPFLRWDLISNSEVHIVHKLAKYLKRVLASEDDDDEESKLEFAKLVHNGRQCAPLQAMQQEVIAKFISMDICSEVEWYKVVQLAWPEARSFIDVGANKGYLGSLFLTLWGGNGYGLSPKDVFDIATKKQAWKSSRNPAGYCRDGFSNGVPLYCPPPHRRVWTTGKCNMVNEDVRVLSLDGSSYLAETLTEIMKDASPETDRNAQLRQGKIWRYLNYAVSDINGIAKFTKQDKDTNPGFEGGNIRGVSKAELSSITNNNGTAVHLRSRRFLSKADIEEVKMTSIDSLFTEERMEALDILKIDTEGNDNKVLNGAANVIANAAGMFTFEGGKSVQFTKAMIKKYDSLGFSCYSTSRAGLFKWNGGCMYEKYMGGFNAKDKGNIFCINRHRAPMAALAFEVLSFPTLTDDVIQSATEPTASKELLQLRSVLLNESNTEMKTIKPQNLVPIYLNIKPFCTPFPTCAKA